MAQPSFFVRHDFLIRRLHSLAGLVPVGVYVIVHLVTNALILNSVAAFQGQVYTIHSLGPALWIEEWTFIFIPLLFHAILGVWLAFEGRPNATRYLRRSVLFPRRSVPFRPNLLLRLEAHICAARSPMSSRAGGGLPPARCRHKVAKSMKNRHVHLRVCGGPRHPGRPGRAWDKGAAVGRGT